MATVTTLRGSLTQTVEAFGYGRDLRRQKVFGPGADHSVDLVAFTQPAPHDLRTSALVGHVPTNGETSSWVCDVARSLAAPFALIAEGDDLALFGVSYRPADDALIHRFPIDGAEVGDEFRRALDPRSVHAAKRGSRQLALFPIDVRLLDAARSRSVETLTERVESVFHGVLEAERWSPATAARVVIGSLASVIIRDKYQDVEAEEPAAIVQGAVERHPDYFAFLADRHRAARRVVNKAIADLAEGIDYSAVDARSINLVYEHLAVTPELRKDLGIFYTPTEFANQVLDTLPIETIAPEERLVLDPACGSGNLLLAAQERIETIAPGSWSTPETHDWLKAHLFGWDIDPVSVEIAHLSLLLSALPLGNNWRVERQDVLGPSLPDIRPTVLISNPPWHNPRGARKETAGAFIDRFVRLLADGGLLACVLPATWLTSSTAKESRTMLSEHCEVFEVWRLPRDVFAPEARVACGVVFARKGVNAKRTSFAFRWVGAGRPRRDTFLRQRRATYQGLAPSPIDGQAFSWGPLEEFLEGRTSERIADVADVVSGVVQKGIPALERNGRLRVLLRGAKYVPYRELDLESTIRIRSIAEFTPSGRDVSRFGSPQVLVQAHRNPDTPWRVRPILDRHGVIPMDAWHAVVPNVNKQVDAEALLAVLASGLANVWVHARVATKRIPVTALETLPLPSPWVEHSARLAQLGARLVRSGPTEALLDAIERTVADAYGLDSRFEGTVRRLVAGSRAPEGRERFALEAVIEPALELGVVRAGAVLGLEGSELRVWAAGGPDEGELHHLPERMPGWLAIEGAVFDVVGSEVETARYVFHRAAHLSDPELFGVNERPAS